MTALERVLSLLEANGKTKKTGNGWDCICPVHESEGSTPSLSVAQGEKGVVITCHVGCSAASVVAKMGLKMSDLFDEPHSKNGHAPPKRRVKIPVKETLYNVLDVEGRLVAVHHRIDYDDGTKSVFWKRNGSWGLQGMRVEDLPLYAIEGIGSWPEWPVVFVEGEKACDAVMARSQPCVGSVTGADTKGKRPGDASLSFLRGRDVILWPDNDAPGRVHMAAIGLALMGVAKSVRWLSWKEAPEKGDAADWSGTEAEFDALLAAAAPFDPLMEVDVTGEPLRPVGRSSEADLVRLCDVEVENVKWISKPRLPIGGITMLVGDPGAGKTMYAIDVCARVTTGRRLEDCYGSDLVGPRSVLYMTCEDGLGDTIRPRCDRAGADVSRVYALRGIRLRDESSKDGQPIVVPFTLQDLSILREVVEQVEPALVVIDPVQGYLGRGVNMDKANEVRLVLSGLRSLAEEFQFSALVIQHPTKNGGGRLGARGLGSQDFRAIARSSLYVANHPDVESPTDYRRVLVHTKGNLAPMGQILGFSIGENGTTFTGFAGGVTEDDIRAADSAPAKKKSGAEAWLRDLLSHGPVSADDVMSAAEKAGHTEWSVKKAKTSVGVVSRREGYGAEAKWLWTV